MLYVLTQDQLAHTKFPLGGMDKPSIRKIAEEQGFCNARKHDSQDICFVPDGDYVGFMERYTGKYYPDGDFLDVNGNVVGRHHGAVRYTNGQRKGLGLALGAPVYVCDKDMEKKHRHCRPRERTVHHHAGSRGLQLDLYPRTDRPHAGKGQGPLPPARAARHRAPAAGRQGGSGIR